MALQVLADMRADGDINDPEVKREHKQIHDEILLEHELEIRRYGLILSAQFYYTIYN
jgi:hypothetical protein